MIVGEEVGVLDDRAASALALALFAFVVGDVGDCAADADVLLEPERAEIGRAHV